MSEGAVAAAATCGCCACVVVLVLILSCYKGLHATKLALVKNSFTGVVGFDTTYHGGRNMIGFWNEYMEFPATVQSIEWLDSNLYTSTTRDLSPMTVRTQDGLNVRLGLIAKYLINKEKLPDIYRSYKMNVEGFFISNLRSSILTTAGRFSATQLYENRFEVANALLETCRQVCAEALHGYLSCWRIDLLTVDMGRKIEVANTMRQVEKQKQYTEMMHRNASLIRAGTSVIESDFDRQIEVVHAKARANAYSLTSEAQANAVNREQEARAKSLSVIQESVTDGTNLVMTQEQLLSYLEKVTLIDSAQGSMVYGAFGSASVFIGQAEL